MKKYILWLGIVLLIAFRYFSSLPKYHDGDFVRVKGKVLSEPTRYDRSQGIDVGAVRVYLPLFPEIGYGDWVFVEGVIEDGKISNGKLIDHKMSGNALFRFRKRLINFYKQTLSPPFSTLLVGVVLGSKEGMTNEFYNELRDSGTIHVVVASGMNVTLVAGFLMNFLVLFVSRRRALVFALVGVWVYAVLSGFDAPIVRAAIMGSVAFGGQVLGRVYSAWRGLFVSVIFMLMAKPLWVSDLGFILSFVATASLMLFNAKVDRLLHFVPSFVRGDLSSTLAASIGVYPIIYFVFGRLNPLSPLINTLVLWTIPVITVLGMVGGVAGVMFAPVGKIIIYLAYPVIWWFITTVRIF